MKKVLLYSILLVAGMALAQALPLLGEDRYPTALALLRPLTMACLAFIMIHVGLEFQVDRGRLRQYAVDYGVAATAAAFPWIFCTLYFLLVMGPPGAPGDLGAWKETLLAARFAAPTSAGILFSMLAAAGLAATWVFRKARILAIFDDLDTVLLMIPLKMLIVGMKWQLGVIVLLMAVQAWAAWRWLHAVRIPATWPWVLGYAVAITAVGEGLHFGSLLVDDSVPIHVEVLLPAFVLGCMIRLPEGADGHPPHGYGEERAAHLVSSAFMVLVGLSMPAVATLAGEGAGGGPRWGVVALHVLAITVISNLGKMFPAFCYRREVPLRQRLAVCIGMFPRGEVGAGVLVLSISYGIDPGMVLVAAVSLALNLVLSGVFIVVVKRLIAGDGGAAPEVAA